MQEISKKIVIKIKNKPYNCSIYENVENTNNFALLNLNNQKYYLAINNPTTDNLAADNATPIRLNNHIVLTSGVLEPEITITVYHTDNTNNKVKISDGIIERSKFNSDDSITKIEDADVITYIDNNAFRDCYSLTSINNLNNCTYINNFAFYGCEALESVGNLSNCTRLGTGAFYGCEALESVGELSNCEYIGNYAFLRCSKLSLNDLSKVTYIGIAAFDSCEKLGPTLDLQNCETIASNAFQFCTNLTSITLQKCTHIGAEAFLYCSKLSSITINSESVCTLDEGVFSYAPIKYIYVPAELVDQYKSANNWSKLSSKIFPIN